MSVTDPCAEHAELLSIRRALVTGQAVKTSRFGDDEVERFRADLPRLDRMIKDAERDCAQSQGKRHVPQRRAIRF